MSPKAPVPARPFEPAFVASLSQLFEERIVFNTLLGLKVTELSGERVCCGIDMRPELIGHYQHQRLHGGVISAVLDATAGLAVMAAIGARHMDEPPEQRLARFAKLGTIDLRIDYLRPGVARISGPRRRCSAWARAWPARAWPSRGRRRPASHRRGGLHRVLTQRCRQVAHRHLARPPVLVDGHVGQLRLGHLDVAPLVADALGIHAHVHRHRGAADALHLGHQRGCRPPAPAA
jgi:acyl-coenzyme A thioesterase PaaI-like protein